ncbi:MAG: hypothetical protein HFG30_02845 [Eubacterium sp.]|jgi:hypothetical protein|nr:hypothetical protein [Eubacterium sp.]
MKINEFKWEAINFFLYTYFGIVNRGLADVREDDKKEMIKKCSYRAYLDMCRTLKFKKENEDNSKNRSEIIYPICDEMAEILNKNGPTNKKIEELYKFLDDKNNEKIVRLREILNLEDMKRKGDDAQTGLHYGQIQKWVNMPLKYMWLIGLLKDEDKNCLQIPIDSIIMREMSDDLETNFPCYNGKIRKYSESSSIPWSKLNKEEYKEIKNSIKTESSPIKWECNAWIKYAEKKRKRGKK